MLLFDVTSRKDFEELNNILSLIMEKHEFEDIPILLIANKIDLVDEREIYKEDIENFVKENSLIGYFEVSCKDGTNVKESFDFLIKFIYER